MGSVNSKDRYEIDPTSAANKQPPGKEGRELLGQAAERVRRLSAKLHPSHNLQTIAGVGFMTEAAALFFVVDPDRFNQRTFRGFHGLIPGANQSSEGESKGVKVTKAGPALLKKYLFLAAGIARQWDVDLAWIYYDQMVHKGKHHNQAVCACATHLGDRILAILKEDRPYERRDETGNSITASEAKAISKCATLCRRKWASPSLRSNLTKWIRSDILTDKIRRTGKAVKGQRHRIRWDRHY